MTYPFRKQLVLETLRENVVVGGNNLEFLISDNQKNLVSHCDVSGHQIKMKRDSILVYFDGLFEENSNI